MIRACVFAVCTATLVVVSLAAQTEPDARARVEGVVAGSQQAWRPIRLSADTITLTGDVLRLNGTVRIVIRPDTLTQADEVALDRGNRTADLIGKVRASLGPSAGVPLARPRIDYR